MDSKNQFIFFLLSIGIGLVGGLLYELFALVRFLFRCNHEKWKIGDILIDITFCIAFACLWVFLSFHMHFPAFRGYMCLGWMLGGVIYLRILHKILALCKKVCYNVLVKIVTKAKGKEKTLQKEREYI
ncbi:MAG: spore cortex biosynthesis protein YabQ [Clostridia bacterium]|nr:spore cortex biosynthesis protein YabQ [Clostridia bacterium]